MDTGMISPYVYQWYPSGMFDLDGALTDKAVFAWWAAAGEAHHPNKNRDRMELLQFLTEYCKDGSGGD